MSRALAVGIVTLGLFGTWTCFVPCLATGGREASAGHTMGLIIIFDLKDESVVTSGQVLS